MESITEVFGATLPLAVAIALSPLPVIALVLLLMSPRGAVTGTLFVVGRVATLAVLLGALVAASDAIEHLTGSAELPAVVRLVLGLALLVLGLTQWRPKPDDEEPALPGWVDSIGRASPGRSLALGGIVTVVNPKELAFLLATGITIGGAAIEGAQEVAAVLLVVAVAASSAVVPLVAMLVAPQRVRSGLDRVREWLTRNTSLVMGVLLLVIGATVLGGAIGDL